MITFKCSCVKSKEKNRNRELIETIITESKRLEKRTALRVIKTVIDVRSLHTLVTKLKKQKKISKDVYVYGDRNTYFLAKE